MSQEIHAAENPPAILCVDDEPGILKAIVRVFRTESLKILTATSGAEGLELLRHHAVQLILTDYRMPGMNGVQFMKEASTLCPDAFCVLLTGYADIGAISEAINEAQTYKILYKPWNDDDLKLTVRSALAHYERNHENRRLHQELAEQNIELQRLAKQLESRLTARTTDFAVCSGSLITIQTLLDHLPCGVLGIDDSGSIVLANHNARVWFGQGQPLLGEWAKQCLPASIFKVFLDTSSETCAGLMPEARELVNGVPLIVHGQRMTTADDEGKPIIAGVLIHADREEILVPPKG